jgi:hypothetical protein
MRLGGVVLFTLMFKRYTHGRTVAIEFHLVSSFVYQPLGASLWKRILEQLIEELSTDPLPKSHRAFRAPGASLDVGPNSLPAMAFNALPVQVALTVPVVVRETFAASFVDDMLYVVH